MADEEVRNMFLPGSPKPTAACTDSFQGASPRELILEACRRNNTSLLEETIEDLTIAAKKLGKKPTEYVAETLNKAVDGVGNGCLHIAATYGSCESLPKVCQLLY